MPIVVRCVYCREVVEVKATKGEGIVLRWGLCENCLRKVMRREEARRRHLTLDTIA